jgi:hypothetical protein
VLNNAMKKDMKNANNRPIIVQCLHCGKELSSRRGVGRKQKYCSPECKNRHRYEVANGRPTGKICFHCGKPLYGANLNKKYCSPKCRSDGALKNQKRKCIICGNEFTSTLSRKRCCSSECGSKLHGETLKETERITATCADCGNNYETHKLFGRNNKFVFRCPDCRLVHERDRVRKRRMMLLQYKEKVNDFEIFERDHWICRICGDPVDQDRRWPDPLSASIDHIKPVHYGGLHISSNLQLAHHICNNRKHNQYREGYRYETWTCT